MSAPNLGELEDSLGYQFGSRALLETAVTHRSFAHEGGGGEHYERMEFLGDAVLGLVVAGWLYGELDHEPEGALSKRKSYLVSEAALVRSARRLRLGEHLRLGVGEERSGGRDKPSLLADCLEAVLGAIFLDGGFAAAQRVALSLVAESELASVGSEGLDAKSALQELLQGQGRPLPEYRHVEASGPDHAKEFRVECRVEGELLGTGLGPTKKAAEQRAASTVLGKLASSAGG